MADSQGSSTAVWQLYSGENDIVKSAVRHAGGKWSAPHRLFDVSDIYGSQVAVDPMGNMTAVWSRREGRGFVVQSAIRLAGGSWSAPVNLSKAGAGSAQVAVDPAGEVTAVWLLARDGNKRSVVQSATRPAGGIWSAPISLSPVKQAARSPQIALDPQGGAAVVWEEEKSGAIQSATRPAGGIWSAPVTLSAAGEWANEPRVAVDSQGYATAVWTNSWPKGNLIESATHPAGGVWSVPINLSVPAHNAEEAQIAVDPQGDATAIWTRSSHSNPPVVQSAMRPAGGSWSAPVDISVHRGQSGFYPRLVMDARGTAIAVWKGNDSNHGTMAIQGATRPLAGSWSTPTDVSNRTSRDRRISEPQIAIGPQGISTVVWVIGARRGGVVQAATSTSLPGR